MAQAFAELEAYGASAMLTHADWLGLLVNREMTRIGLTGDSLRPTRPKSAAKN